LRSVTGEDATGRSPEPLISVADLAAWLAADRPPTLLDVRWRLGGPSGAGEFVAGHLPGAVFLDLDTKLCGPPGRGGRHPLPDPHRLEAVLQMAGVRQGRPVVVYDGGDGAAAARTWWTLRWAGHRAVQVLDGGYAAWVAAGQPVTTAALPPVPGDVRVRPGAMPVLDATDAARLAADGVLLDARAPERYRGESEPIDRVAGHIPGAVNLPAGTLAADSGMVDTPRLRERFAQVGVDEQVPVGAYCGSGVNAAQLVLALHAVGRTDAALYVGSWSHWITDSDRPVATGPQP
jgi:thiosulfate/3-mercaptopyruvate sulfurtransferase